ncbi:hypothetical protein Q4601_05915 [Shewanella sp. 1_MG-2023]|uniref:hypothetical protein n=1 Tax=unclassified Shewanella TaxID=196818 RepID=UPI0026E1CBEF|nr:MULTISPECIES: hypothetical protein [unclassified Shewanella]MDO6611659.1 hypothetical protein [Shewanella sp. 7_MG-2023]MDO6771514.1 hypothetical protein [Shewanella sp. 2_MG-2023]MDO6793837.1 hypothetical protein [Shewanella sp. 1_MG-2023]
MKFKYLLIVLSLGISFQLAANDNAQHVQSSLFENPRYLQTTIATAIEHLEQTRRKEWSYEVSRFENEEGNVTSSLERFTPHKDISQRWSLELINGQLPTKQQTSDFIAGKVESAENKDNGHNISIKPTDLIQQGSLTFAAEDEFKLQANFNVYLKKLGEEGSKKLHGQLIYDKNNQFIETLIITNTESFSPMFSAKITDFKLVFSFIKLQESVLLYQNQLAMKGHFAFFTDIDETSTDTFSDYQYIGAR